MVVLIAKRRMRVIAWMQEGSAFRFTVDVVDCAVRLGRCRVAKAEAAIVEDLCYQDDVGESVVDGQYDHGWQDALQDRTKYVENISS